MINSADLTFNGFSQWPDSQLPAKSPREYCTELDQKFQQLSWQPQPCGSIPWQFHHTSTNGYPLIYWSFGHGKQTTLLLSGVHPDEFTPVPMGFRLARYIQENPKVVDPNLYRVIIAPLVNPDGFLKPTASRTNSRGVDINRNFFTSDWYSNAHYSWRFKKHANPRRFPGYFPDSEPETHFQTFLISHFKPDKILSIHAPLGFLDYDGPGDRQKRPEQINERRAKDLAKAISQKSKNYRIVDYSFYPGSLGNYAGNDHEIPTVTLELETTDIHKIDLYWNQFLPGLIQSIQYPYKRIASRSVK